tara:strand:- start:1836 stop:2189 length:354 start_codon:yes stop_codon:yes gene_type:complete
MSTTEIFELRRKHDLHPDLGSNPNPNHDIDHEPDPVVIRERLKPGIAEIFNEHGARGLMFLKEVPQVGTEIAFTSGIEECKLIGLGDEINLEKYLRMTRSELIALLRDWGFTLCGEG